LAPDRPTFVYREDVLAGVVEQRPRLRHPGRGRLVHPVPEGEEGIAREHRALGVVPLLARLVNREKRRIDPAHLARADPDRRLLAHEHDGVRLDRPHCGPGET